MAIHISRLVRPLSRISHSSHRGRVHLSTGYLARRQLVQEFPERRANNVIPNEYVLILPESLDEHEGTNELLKLAKQHDIDYSKLSTEVIFKGLSRALIDFENYLTDVDTRQTNELKSTREFFRDLERHLYPLDCAFNVATVLVRVEGAFSKHKEMYTLLNRYYQARGRRFAGVFKDSIEQYVLDGFKKLPEQDKKLVRMYHGKNTSGNFLRSLDASSQLPSFREHLNTSTSRFKRNLEQVDQQFSHIVDDPDILASISSDFDDKQSLHHKERTPVQVTPSTYAKFMRSCPDRFVRQTLWETYNRRCSPKGPPKLNNMALIDQIRVFRRKIADLSGYRSHLDYRLSEAMANSKQQITDMLQYINEQNIKELDDRLQELTDFADDNSGGSQAVGSSGLAEYDVDYWAHRYAHDVLVGQTETQLKQYFSLPDVMNGLKSYFRSYFGIEIKSSEKQPPYWDANLQKLDVERDGKLLGSIIYDPYLRPNKTVLHPLYARIRCKSQESNLLPMRLISTAFKQDVHSKQAHISFTDIANLFYSFGIVLQRLLYNYDYYELNTYGALEVDANQLFPNLCLAHLLTDRKILQACSRREGSKPIDSELASRILRAHTYFRCFRTSRELYMAHLDLEAHASLRDIGKLAAEIWPIYSPFPRSPDCYDFCAFDGIFAGSNDGTQYSGLWSKQLVNLYLSETHFAEDDGKTNLDAAQVRPINEKLIENLFAPDNFNTKDKLTSVIGRSCEPTKTKIRII